MIWNSLDGFCRLFCRFGLVRGRCIFDDSVQRKRIQRFDPTKFPVLSKIDENATGIAQPLKFRIITTGKVDYAIREIVTAFQFLARETARKLIRPKQQPVAATRSWYVTTGLYFGGTCPTLERGGIFLIIWHEDGRQNMSEVSATRRLSAYVNGYAGHAAVLA